jgi:membrane protein required for colicin V production
VFALPLNILDVAILGIVGLSALVGLFRGFVREVLSIAAWFGAGWVAITFYQPVHAVVAEYIENPTFSGLAAGGSLFLVTLVLLMLIADLLSRGVRKASILGPADRTLGLLFGVLRGAILVALGFIAILHLVEPEEENPEWVENSRLLPHVRVAASLIEKLVPWDIAPGDDEKGHDSPSETEDRDMQSGPDSNGETGYTPQQRQQIPNLLQKQPAE